MIADLKPVIPVWPEELQEVDIVRARFVLDFLSPCTLQPADFLGLGRILKVSGRQMLDHGDAIAIRQWEALFQPAVSYDPVARRKFQKPAPAYVITIPIKQKKTFDVGDQLECEVLFIGTGIPLIHVFLRSLIHLGRLGLVAGEGQYEVTEVYSRGAGTVEDVVWRSGRPLETLSCSVLPMSWLFRVGQVTDGMTIKFATPTRLLVDGKPLRKPRFNQIFPFVLRRVTSMLHAHGHIELNKDISGLFDLAQELEILESRLEWCDWRTITRQGMAIGGFQGQIKLQGQAIEHIYWIIAVASLFGLGKGASYGAGQIILEC